MITWLPYFMNNNVVELPKKVQFDDIYNFYDVLS